MLTLQLRDGYYVPQMDALSRVVQGILTGIGFLGAGVILRVNEGRTVGLTTAATIWTCAVMGVTCGLGHWSIVAISTAIVLVVLILGNPAERFLTGVFKGSSQKRSLRANKLIVPLHPIEKVFQDDRRSFAVNPSAGSLSVNARVPQSSFRLVRRGPFVLQINRHL